MINIITNILFITVNTIISSIIIIIIKAKIPIDWALALAEAARPSRWWKSASAPPDHSSYTTHHCTDIGHDHARFVSQVHTMQWETTIDAKPSSMQNTAIDAKLSSIRNHHRCEIIIDASWGL